MGGNLTFYLNGQEYVPQVRTNEKISFVTLNFTGVGDNTLDIVGTDYLSGLTDLDESNTTDMMTTSVTSPQETQFWKDSSELLYFIVSIVILVIIVITILIKIKKRN